MINSKTLGTAAGVQYQGVIDKSEGTNLPSLANGVIVGRFKRGRMDKPFKVTASNYQALLGRDPSNPSYLAVEDAFKRGVSEVSILRVGGMASAVSESVLNFIKFNNNTNINGLLGAIGGIVYSIDGGEILVNKRTLNLEIGFNLFSFIDTEDWRDPDAEYSFSLLGDDGFNYEGEEDITPVSLDATKFYMWGYDLSVFTEDLLTSGMGEPLSINEQTTSITFYPASKLPSANIDYDIFDLLIDPINYSANELAYFSERGINPAIKNPDGSYTVKSKLKVVYPPYNSEGVA